MAKALVTLCIAIALFSGETTARSLQQAPSCSGNAPFEVLPFNNYGRSFHSIMNAAFNVKDIATCAKLCINAPGCTCAYYPGDGSCQWRQSPCSQSELFVSSTPVSKPTGLVSICPHHAAKSRATAVAVKTYAPCGGAKYTGNKCCGKGDHCVEQTQWYSQCRPVSSPIPKGWSGKIVTAAGC